MAYSYPNEFYRTPNTQPNQFYNNNVNNWGNYSQPQTSMVVFVNGEEGAKNYPVGAGNTVILMDFNTGHFWIKSTAQNGMIQPMRDFTFTEILPKAEQPVGEYVTKQELDELRTYLDSQFTGIRNQLFTQKRGQVNNDKAPNK